MKMIMNERDGSSCFSHNKRRVLKTNLDFNLLKMKFAMQQLKPVRTWTTVSFTKTNTGLLSRWYFPVSYLWIPTGVEFFHCSNVLLHSLVRAGISQGFPSLPKSKNISEPLTDSTRCFILTSVEHSKQIHQNPFRACKAVIDSAWNGQVFSGAVNGQCQGSSAVKGSSRGPWPRLEHSLCSQSCSYFHILLCACHTANTGVWHFTSVSGIAAIISLLNKRF